MEGGVSGVLMVNAVRLVVPGEQLEGGYVITLHQEMEDRHVVGVKCKLQFVMLWRAVSCDRNSHRVQNIGSNHTRKFMQKFNHFILEKLVVKTREMRCLQK